MEFDEDDKDLPLLGGRRWRLFSGCRCRLSELGGDKLLLLLLLLPPPRQTPLVFPRGKRWGFNSTELEGDGERCRTTSAVSLLLLLLFDLTTPRGAAIPRGPSLLGVDLLFGPTLGARCCFCWDLVLGGEKLMDLLL